MRRSVDSSLSEAINLRLNSDDCGEKAKIRPPGTPPSWSHRRAPMKKDVARAWIQIPCCGTSENPLRF
ncbi:hypothetical protein ES332_D08G123800v1 [Gossypium tomentosum]|uniref:Uncharacterized protein n=1 Tax=Gossypium tomentosum TaxID=34277 RepID=A0A5D2JTS7_GOSTO|nr:hypothetical protein ES332_D08G123800v1 [Gossypium tomentosum]